LERILNELMAHELRHKRLQWDYCSRHTIILLELSLEVDSEINSANE